MKGFLLCWHFFFHGLVCGLKEFQEVKKYASIPEGLVIDTINEYDETGKTPLLHASRIGHLEVVLNLLKVGADVNIASQYANETTVYLAAEGGHEIVVSELISHHADVNIPNSHGVSPIYIASQSGHVKVVERLLAAGARLTPVDGITPLMVAAIRGNSNIVKILGNHSISELNQANKQGETALMLCTISRDFSCLQYLLDQGADCNLSDRKGYTVIMHAAIRSCVDMLEYLISHGCDMEAKDRAGLTALQLAQERSNFDAMDILLGLGAEIGPGVRYRMKQEVKLKRDETFRKKSEEALKKLTNEERQKQNQVDVAIRDRLEKNKPHDSKTLGSQEIEL